MKSSFLSLIVLSLMMVSAFAQDAALQAAPKSSFDKFYERLKVSYFGAFQGSCLTDWERGACDEYGKEDPSYAHNLFNQISFNYNFGAKFNFVVNPRWTLYTGSTKAQPAHSRGNLVLEDTLVGFAGAWYKSPSEKFVAWSRIGARLPVSRASREADITYQPEAFTIFSYDFSKIWSVGLYTQLRLWVYDQQYTDDRYRFFFAPYVQYVVNDKTKVQVFYENYSENDERGREPSYQDFKNKWSNAMVAVAWDLTPKLNFMPFLGYMLNTRYSIKDRPADPMWTGFWLSYQIK